MMESFYLVEVCGSNPGRAAGLLAVAGIENINCGESSVTARLRASDAASAVARIERSLAEEQFVVSQARKEHDPRFV
jgi:hypothetical protein